jgi:hypothetical protein
MSENLNFCVGSLPSKSLDARVFVIASNCRAIPVGYAEVLLDPSHTTELRIIGFGLLEDGKVGIGVFPEAEEILIGDFRLSINSN